MLANFRECAQGAILEEFAPQPFLVKVNLSMTFFATTANKLGWDQNQEVPDGRWRRLAHGKAEILHGDGEAVQNLGVDGLVLEVDKIHLFTDLLQGGLGAEGSKIGTNVTVGFSGNLENYRGSELETSSKSS